MESHISYHVSGDGEPRQCYAPPGECPVARKMGMPDLPHFQTIQEARLWYENNNEEDLFPTIVSPGLLVNDLDDAFEVERVDENGDPLMDNSITMAEAEAMNALEIAEASIEEHQIAVSNGENPYKLYNMPQADDMAESYIDWKEYRDAFLNGDYDKARLVHARAVATAYEAFGPIYMSPEELVETVR